MSHSSERRNQPRLSQDGKLFVQVVTSNDDPALVGTTVACSTVDVSAQGLRIHMDREVSEGCALELWVDIPGRSPKFFLAGDVKWSTPLEDEDGYLVGIRLKDGPTDDLSTWRKLFADG